MKSVKVHRVRGMHDLLPEEAERWCQVEAKIADVCAQYGYRPIRFPIVESTDLFKRTVGDATDIVEKEMYSFPDRDGQSLSLRPEGTAGCVRAGIEAELFRNQTQRLWYQGPMFRYERPQRGRCRQFHQIGVEAYGFSGPEIDAEMILLSARIWRALGLADQVNLQLNSLGSAESRQAYREKLIEYFSKHQATLDEDSQRRLHTNPLRILDSKNPAMAELISGAPLLVDSLDEESKQHFDRVCQLLTTLGVSHEVNPRLVRGLDYYNRTVFEWVSPDLGAQATVCAGGRYDALVAQLGGPETTAVGFALGMERLLELVGQLQQPSSSEKIYFIAANDEALSMALRYAEALREQLPSCAVELNLTGASFKSQFKKADKSGAYCAIVLGEDEVQQQRVTVKYLRDDTPQETLTFEQFVAKMKQYIDIS